MGFNINFGQNNNENYNILKDLEKGVAIEIIKNQNEAKKIGIIGKIFGSNENTAINIVGTIVFILVVAGIFSIFFERNYNDYWKYTSSIITTCIGYILGKKNS